MGSRLSTYLKYYLCDFTAKINLLVVSISEIRGYWILCLGLVKKMVSILFDLVSECVLGCVLECLGMRQGRF